MNRIFILFFPLVLIIGFAIAGYNNYEDSKAEYLDRGFQESKIVSLVELTEFELLKYEEFRKSYDDEALLGLDPIAICKMYIYASRTEDYETQYEFYTTNEDQVMWSKEDDKNIPKEDRIKDYRMYEDVYDLKVIFETRKSEEAIITWYSINGYIDEGKGPWEHQFQLTKYGEIWKVCFLPIQ